MPWRSWNPVATTPGQTTWTAIPVSSSSAWRAWVMATVWASVPA